MPIAPTGAGIESPSAQEANVLTFTDRTKSPASMNTSNPIGPHDV